MQDYSLQLWAQRKRKAGVTTIGRSERSGAGVMSLHTLGDTNVTSPTSQYLGCAENLVQQKNPIAKLGSTQAANPVPPICNRTIKLLAQLHGERFDAKVDIYH